MKIHSRVCNEPNASLLALGDCARVKYPSLWGEQAKEKLGHAPLLCGGVFDCELILYGIYWQKMYVHEGIQSILKGLYAFWFYRKIMLQHGVSGMKGGEEE